MGRVKRRKYNLCRRFLGREMLMRMILRPVGRLRANAYAKALILTMYKNPRGFEKTTGILLYFTLQVNTGAALVNVTASSSVRKERESPSSKVKTAPSADTVTSIKAPLYARRQE